jgi:hypothetical protein
MATNFPTSLDSLTNPTSSDSLASPSHAAQHANVNDAVEALQAKVGVDGSAVTSSLDYQLNAIGTYTTYTPTFTSISFSSYTARYTQVNKLVHVWFSGVLDSTVGGTIQISLPTDCKAATGNVLFAGQATADDDNTGSQTRGNCFVRSGGILQFRTIATGGTSLGWNATTPFTWASGDLLSFDLTYEVD